MNKALQRKSQIAWGVFAICMLFILETWNADRQMPNPATPYVWAGLGTVALGAFVAALWFGHRARRS